jgi:hypothetical protein
MFTRPFLPFRIRPLRDVHVRRSPLQTADLIDVLDAAPPVAVKAVRRPMKASPVLAAGRRARGGEKALN